MILTEYLTVVDNPSSQNYIRDDYMHEYSKWVASKFNKEKIKVRDQFDDSTTYKACTNYALCAVYNWYNVSEYESKWVEFEQVNPKTYWHIFQNSRWRPNVWSDVQTMLKFYRKMWWIDWHMEAKTTEWAKNAIDNWFVIYTWSSKFDWKKSWEQKKAVLWNWGWHAFSIIWYDTNWFIAINSFGADWWDKWYFTIPYEHFDKLFSKNVVIDKDDTGIINELNFEREYRKAIELGITNWLDPDKPATRKEVAVMIRRATNNLLK